MIVYVLSIRDGGKVGEEDTRKGPHATSRPPLSLQNPHGACRGRGGWEADGWPLAGAFRPIVCGPLREPYLGGRYPFLPTRPCFSKVSGREGGPGARKGLRSPPETVPPLHF